jgi:hypothetical protein
VLTTARQALDGLRDHRRHGGADNDRRGDGAMVHGRVTKASLPDGVSVMPEEVSMLHRVRHPYVVELFAWDGQWCAGY